MESSGGINYTSNSVLNAIRSFLLFVIHNSGYYLGYLLVHYISKEVPLTELIRISGSALFPMVKEFFGKTKESFQDLKNSLK